MQKLSSQVAITLSATLSVLTVSSLVALLACGGSQPGAQAPDPEVPPAAEPPAPVAEAITTAEGPAAIGTTLEATFQPKSGSKLSGTATLSETPEGVKGALAVEGISPGEHGVHVHEKGDCSAPDGASAGDHFNPETHPHALPSTSPRHLGDLGNITVGADGKGTLEIVATDANLKAGDPNSFAGRAIIIHEKKDDGGQPTGNAGGRSGCAVIQ